MSMFGSNAAVKDLRAELAEVRDVLGRTAYRDDRADIWLDTLPIAIADVLGAEAVDFESGRRTSDCQFKSGATIVAAVRASSTDHSVTFTSLLHGDVVGGHRLVLDDDPSFDDLTPTQVARLEVWWRHALTGQRFDPSAAAATLNAL